MRSDSLDILVVEDDARVASSLRKGLEEEGYTVTVARSLLAAREQLAAGAYALVLLDIGLPDGDGLTLLRDLRASGNPLPVLALTARDAVADRVRGLDTGADDYLVKPFAFPELLARVRALTRRAKEGVGRTLAMADLSVDLIARRVTRAGRDIELTAREFDLLVYLMEASGQIVSRDMLVRDVWKVQSRATSMDNVIDVHMSHLREKIDRDFPEKLLMTVRGVGFAMRPQGGA